MKNVIAIALAGVLLAACGEPPPDSGVPAIEVKQSAVHWCLPWIVCPDTPPAAPNFDNCTGSWAYTDIAFNSVRLYQEYPPDTWAGWCAAFVPHPAGVVLPGSPYSYNDNVSTVAIGPEAHIDLFEDANGQGAHMGLFGHSSLRPNVIDLHVFEQVGHKPPGWWADRVSSFRVCLQSQAVNNRCP